MYLPMYHQMLRNNLVLVLKQTKLQYKVMNGFQDKLKNMVLLLPNGNIFVGY